MLYGAIRLGCSGKYRKMHKVKIWVHKMHKLYTTQKRKTMHNVIHAAEQNYPGSVDFTILT